MKAHLIDTHLLVPRSRSSAKVKVKYKGYISQKTAVSGAFVFHKHILFNSIQYNSKFNSIPHNPDLMTHRNKPFKNITGKGENAGNQHFLLLSQCFPPDQRLES